MSIINPDLTDIGPIEPGTYPIEILSADAKTSKAGSQMVVCDVNVSVGEKPRKRTIYLVTEGTGAFGFDQLLRACNLDADADRLRDKNADHSFDTDVLVGQQCLGVVENELYNGSMQDKISTYLRA